MSARAERKTAATRRLENGVTLIAERRPLWSDLFHRFLGLSTPRALGGILLGLVLINVVFGLLYMGVGGVANARPDSFLDAFSFSVQTLGTVGYGSMYPESDGAKLLSDVEALLGLVWTAVATGLVFLRLTRPEATLRFTSNVVITRLQGQPTLICRIGNDRGNLLVDASARIVLVRRERDSSGAPFYRNLDLHLVRDRSISFTRSWTIMHRIDTDSPLWGLNAQKIIDEDIEINALVTGIDDTSLLPMHARATWSDERIRLNHRLCDVLRELPDGSLEADARRFDAVEPDDGAPLWD